MKRILAFAISLFFLFNLLTFPGNFTLGGMFGNYFVADPIYKDLYGSGNFIFWGFVSIGVMNRLELRGDIGYFNKRGKTSLTGESTSFSLIPITIGARFRLINLEHIRPYLGAGLNYCLFNEKARIGDTSDTTLGLHFEGGSYIVIAERLYFDLNFRYSISDAKPFDETIKLGGFSTGIGVGYTF
ncbi:MAG: outer membrane beta-barrel protein [Candidatus Aminicenantes bacterium]|nr:MAG: outer membrane beta-barrel protein [Candidatus Aminicenantes bacterium]